MSKISFILSHTKFLCVKCYERGFESFEEKSRNAGLECVDVIDMTVVSKKMIHQKWYKIIKIKKIYKIISWCQEKTTIFQINTVYIA